MMAAIIMYPLLTAFLPCVTFLLVFLEPPKSIICAQTFASRGVQTKAVILGVGVRVVQECGKGGEEGSL